MIESFASSCMFFFLFSLSISLNYRVSSFLNLALASVYSCGAYVSFYMGKGNYMFFLSLLLGGIIGVVIYEIVKIGRNRLEKTIVSLGLALLIEEMLRIGTKTGYFMMVESDLKTIFARTLVLFLFATILLLIIFKTDIGLRVKFVEEDAELAELYGVNVNMYRRLGVMISSMIVFSLGFVNSGIYPVFASMGWGPLVSAIVVSSIAAQLGGVGLKHYVNVFLVSLSYSILFNWIL